MTIMHSQCCWLSLGHLLGPFDSGSRSGLRIGQFVLLCMGLLIVPLLLCSGLYEEHRALKSSGSANREIEVQHMHN